MIFLIQIFVVVLIAGAVVCELSKQTNHPEEILLHISIIIVLIRILWLHALLTMQNLIPWCILSPNFTSFWTFLRQHVNIYTSLWRRERKKANHFRSSSLIVSLLWNYLLVVQFLVHAGLWQLNFQNLTCKDYGVQSSWFICCLYSRLLATWIGAMVQRFKIYG